MRGKAEDQFWFAQWAKGESTPTGIKHDIV